ncbi:MAG TPA: hypothetical protein VF506_14755, partial [Streptosporangiaceae bacterium]
LLGRLLVPAVILTSDGAAPVPAAVVAVPVPAVVLLCLVVMAVPVIAAAVAGLRRPDAASAARRFLLGQAG